MWHLSCGLIHITETAEEKLQSKYQRALRAVCSLRHTGPEEKDDNATSKSAPHQEEHVLLPQARQAVQAQSWWPGSTKRSPSVK